VNPRLVGAIVLAFSFDVGVDLRGAFPDQETPASRALRHDMVVELEVVYVRNVEQRSSDLEVEACRTLVAMSSPRRLGTAPR
jgi:hypothetical protein